jgi:hypothetical protein
MRFYVVFLLYQLYQINFLIRAISFFIQDLDLTKPAAPKPAIRGELIVSTKEVLSQADFRVSTSVRAVLL